MAVYRSRTSAGAGAFAARGAEAPPTGEASPFRRQYLLISGGVFRGRPKAFRVRVPEVAEATAGCHTSGSSSRSSWMPVPGSPRKRGPLDSAAAGPAEAEQPLQRCQYMTVPFPFASWATSEIDTRPVPRGVMPGERSGWVDLPIPSAWDDPLAEASGLSLPSALLFGRSVRVVRGCLLPPVCRSVWVVAGCLHAFWVPKHLSWPGSAVPVLPYLTPSWG